MVSTDVRCNRAPLYLASLYLRLKAMAYGFGCLLLPASVPRTEIPHNKKYGVVIMSKLITVASRQVMREIDLNSLYVLPPYHAYDQSAYPKRGSVCSLLECKITNLLFFFDGGGLAEDFPGTIISSVGSTVSDSQITGRR